MNDSFVFALIPNGVLQRLRVLKARLAHRVYGAARFLICHRGYGTGHELGVPRFWASNLKALDVFLRMLVFSMLLASYFAVTAPVTWPSLQQGMSTLLRFLVGVGPTRNIHTFLTVASQIPNWALLMW